MKNIDIVVARYNENIDWIKKIKDYRVILYNKGKDINGDFFIHTLPNWGRESDTILTHIIKYYHDLSDITVFLQGNPFDHFPNVLKVLPHLSMGLDIFGSIVYQYRCDQNPIYHTSKMVTLGTNWDYNNKSWDWDYIWMLSMSKVFRVLFHDYGLPSHVRCSWGAQFAVSKEVIQKFTLEQYQEVKKISDRDYYLPWGLEKYWLYLFTTDQSQYLKDKKLKNLMFL